MPVRHTHTLTPRTKRRTGEEPHRKKKMHPKVGRLWRCMHVRHWHAHTTNREKDRRRTGSQEEDALEASETLEMHAREALAHSHNELGKGAETHRITRRRRMEGRETVEMHARETLPHSHHKPGARTGDAPDHKKE